MKFKRKHLAFLGTVAVVGVAYAATQITIKEPFAVSDGVSGDKPKIQRAGDGTLVVAYGDNADSSTKVYDVKAQKERLSRDIFVKTCKPGTTRPDTVVRTCDDKADWTTPINISKSATLQSTGQFDWRGTLGTPTTYPGDIDKPNIKTSGSVMVLTWVSKYCPDGDLATAGMQPSVQRGVRYLERDGGRVIPFSCAWTAYSANNGVIWQPAIQLSTGERDAIQDASSGGYNSDTKKGQAVISWQEDPKGLQLGEADGPGDGASGANVSNGTDVWYTSATIDLSIASTPADDFVLAPAVRLTDNFTNSGIGGADEANPVFNGSGMQVDKNTIESGQAGAARPNIGIISTQAIVTYEETKGSTGLDEGKFIRYHSFTFNKPTYNALDAASNDPKGCIISDPNRNARRVRFLTQSPADAGANGIQLAIFWKEGVDDKGGPSDIVVRRAGGSDATTVAIKPTNMVPAVGANCATSDYVTAIGLNNVRAQNISSRSPNLTDTDNGLSDDTQINAVENALAHRGVLRGKDLWIGYTYTNDLVKMWAQLDNYNFWMRKFNVDANSWNLPKNLTNIADKRINVREPRIFGTPKGSSTTCPSGIATDPTTTDPTTCQNADVVNLAWGTQENVSPFDPDGGDDLGIYITQSNDAGETFATPVRYSTAKGSLFQDDESAYEAQIVSRPDGTRFYGVWNQADSTTGITTAQYASGDVAVVADPAPAPVYSGGGGCTAADGQQPLDPMLPLFAALGLAGWGLRRARRS